MKENCVKMWESSNLPKGGMGVRTSRREGRSEGGVKKRKGTPLSLYYPSVTELLWSCCGYRDSCLSVLLAIAQKGTIQCWATIQICLSHFFNLFQSSVSICVSLSPFLWRSHLPSASPAFQSPIHLLSLYSNHNLSFWNVWPCVIYTAPSNCYLNLPSSFKLCRLSSNKSDRVSIS